MPAALNSKGIVTLATREEWLNSAVADLRVLYSGYGVDVPAEVRVSVGFPSTGRKGKRIGECWHSSASADQHHEIFIRPDQSDVPTVLGILAHELVHAAVPAGSGHGKVFKRAALSVGLTGPMRSALPGEALAAYLEGVAKALGPFPGAALGLGVAEGGPKKQSTRLLKCECPECGYTVRTTSAWLEFGAPICPLDQIAMEVA